MSQGSTRIQRSLERLVPSFSVCLIWLLIVCWILPRIAPSHRLTLGAMSLAASVATAFVLIRAERKRWLLPTMEMARRIRDLTNQRASAVLEPSTPDFVSVVRAVEELRALFKERMRFRKLMGAPSKAWEGQNPLSLSPNGFSEFESAFSPETGEFNLAHSGNFSTIEMVNRLAPRDFIWIESSIAEQEFLGWSLVELRGKSFLDIVTDGDRAVALESLRLAIERGESLGRVVRVHTASGALKDIELNVGARYGPDKTISHLRCHLTDVTEKVRAESELRLRTIELTEANEQLREINRELEELKDRYTDLYQNAPTMYFSLNSAGEMIECNQTLLTTLEFAREDLIGQPFLKLLPVACHELFRERFADLGHENSMECPSTWRKRGGDIIEVWINASVVPDTSEQARQVRCVARDVTARRKLESELERKNESLGRANTELSLKNRELDDFVYVVSHDLQEPLRTLIAFSDFLLKDYGERFDEEGREYVNYLIDASRRMRTMILAMLHLSRAGKVLGDFASVDMNELLAIVKADLGELIRARNAEIRVVGSLPIVWGDWNRLTQLLTNLIANGLKFNRSPAPRVEVGCVETNRESESRNTPDPDRTDDDDYVTLSIKDNGIGIDPEFHQTIFQLFRRLHTQEEYEGTGAGLAICGKIVQAHGGRIWVESTLNAGSTFFVRLRRRLSRPAGNDPTVIPDEPSVAVQDRADESRNL